MEAEERVEEPQVPMACGQPQQASSSTQHARQHAATSTQHAPTTNHQPPTTNQQPATGAAQANARSVTGMPWQVAAAATVTVEPGGRTNADVEPGAVVIVAVHADRAEPAVPRARRPVNPARSALLPLEAQRSRVRHRRWRMRRGNLGGVGAGGGAWITARGRGEERKTDHGADPRQKQVGCTA